MIAWLLRCVLRSAEPLLPCSSAAGRLPHRSRRGPRAHFSASATTRGLPLQFVDHGRVNRRSEPIAVHDVSFHSMGKRIEGFLLLPPGRARRPAVVFVHGSGGDRRELLDRARALAARGVVALTITEPSTSSPPVRSSGGAEALLKQLQATQVRDVVAVRRAVDVLRSRPQVDPERIGYLGWSAGARTGTFVAASEPRVKALALLSAGAAPVAAYVANAPPSIRPVVRRVLTSLDPDPLRRAGSPGQRPARGRPEGRDRPPRRAGEHRPRRAEGNDGPLVRRSSRAQRRRLPRRLRLAAAQDLR